MLNPAHLLEIAVLLLAAFLVGAVVGSLARLAVARLAPAKAAAPSPVMVAEPSKPAEAPALVEAPVIADVTRTPTPTAPAEVPAPDFTEALLALAGDKPGSLASKIRMPSIAPLPKIAVTKPTEAMRPARVAGETTSGQVVPHPRNAIEPARVAALGASAEVIPFPLEKLATETSAPSAAVVATPVPVVEPAPPAVATTEAVEARGEPIAETVATPSVEEELEPTVRTVAVETAGEADAPAADAELADVAAVEVLPDELPGAPAEIALPDVLPPAEAIAAEPAAAIEPSTEDDEAAAMRAIEGNWSPRRAASPRARKVDLPEVTAEAAVAASAAAVASATQAANLVAAAESEEAPGKPEGLPAPRLGVKDDLTHVIGILPIIETALNTLGIFHFDQVADLTDENAGWIENHLGIAGRIGREHWREQARELALAMAGTKKAAGQQ